MKTRNIQIIFIGTLAVLAVAATLHLLQGVLIPLVIAMMISLMLSPAVSRLSKMHVPRILGIVVVMALLFIVLYVVGRLFYSSLISFTEVFGSYQNRYTQIMTELWVRFDIPEEYFPRLGWTQSLIDMVLQITGSFVTFGSSLGMVLLFLVFMLQESPLLWRKFRRAFPRKTVITMGRAVSDVTRQVARYLRVKTAISAITGLMVWGALSLIGQDLAALWGLLAFLLNYIPNIGSFFIMVATMTLGLIQFYPEWNKVAAVWVTMPLIQITMGNIIDPQLQGERLDLSPLVILVSLVIWGWIWGVVGMFLSVPITVGIKSILAHNESLKPFAVMMGSGRMSRSFRRNWRRTRKDENQNEETKDVQHNGSH